MLSLVRRRVEINLILLKASFAVRRALIPALFSVRQAHRPRPCELLATQGACEDYYSWVALRKAYVVERHSPHALTGDELMAAIVCLSNLGISSGAILETIRRALIAQ